METTSVPTVEVLSAARRILSHPRRWCRHSAAESRDHTPVGSANPRAIRFCGLGAISRAAWHASLYDVALVEPFAKDELYRGQKALIASLDRLSGHLFGLEVFSDVNDRLGRKAVIAVIDAAIAELTLAAA